jgi:hypothetical protein
MKILLPTICVLLCGLCNAQPAAIQQEGIASIAWLTDSATAAQKLGVAREDVCNQLPSFRAAYGQIGLSCTRVTPQVRFGDEVKQLKLNFSADDQLVSAVIEIADRAALMEVSQACKRANDVLASAYGVGKTSAIALVPEQVSTTFVRWETRVTRVELECASYGQRATGSIAVKLNYQPFWDERDRLARERRVAR